MNSDAPPLWRTLLAFAAIYLIWGSTFYAIRLGVAEVPPFLLAGMRFLAAGVILFGWAMARGHSFPGWRQWRSVAVLAALMFVLDYGLLFWAEQSVPSGLAAVMLATIPAFMALSEIVLLRTRQLSLNLSLALATGFGGIAVLISPTINLGGEPIDRSGAVALLIAAVTWSIASALLRKLDLPSSKALSSGAQMSVGGVLLLVVAAAAGELRGFEFAGVSARAWLALLYLVLPGSVVGFTAYLWLLHHQSPTKVGTYAYVNPVVAVLIGYFLGGEPLSARTLLGTAFVLAAVIMITAQSNISSSSGSGSATTFPHQSESSTAGR